MSTEAMKLAASVLKGSQEYKRGHTTFVEAVEELEEALAQPQQEPVAWMHPDEYKTYFTTDPSEELLSNGYWTPLYASPQPAQQEPVEYWTVANGWVSDQAEVPAAVWVEPDFWEHCNRVNCGTAYRLPAPGRQPLYTSPPARKPLTDEQVNLFINGRGDEDDDDYVEPTGDGFGLTDADLVRLVRRVEVAHGIKENT